MEPPREKNPRSFVYIHKKNRCFRLHRSEATQPDRSLTAGVVIPVAHVARSKGRHMAKRTRRMNSVRGVAPPKGDPVRVGGPSRLRGLDVTWALGNSAADAPPRRPGRGRAVLAGASYRTRSRDWSRRFLRPSDGVRSFQGNHRLAADGIVGPSTWQALESFRSTKAGTDGRAAYSDAYA